MMRFCNSCVFTYNVSLHMLVYKIKPKPWTNIAGKTQTSENKYYLRKFRLRNFRYTNIRLKFHTRSHQFGKFLQAFCWECWWFSLSSWLFVMTATSLACSRYGPLGSYMAMGHIGRLYGLSTWDGCLHNPTFVWFALRRGCRASDLQSTMEWSSRMHEARGCS